MIDSITLHQIEQASQSYRVPEIDVLLISLNILGARSSMPHPRLRMKIRPLGQKETWRIILPLDNETSPFEVTEHHILLNGSRVADVIDFENDDVVLTYLRNDGKSLTFNTNSRSKCIGCVFCPNVIEDSADETLRDIESFKSLMQWLCADNSWMDLSHVEVITVSSGCFYEAQGAIRHLSSLKMAASEMGFRGRIHILSSVIREAKDLELAVEALGDFHLTLTLECFSRRDLLLKNTKASLTLDKAGEVLASCRDLGIMGDFTYLVGLDDLVTMERGLECLAKSTSTFPRIQVYQAHNDYMRMYRHADATQIDYFLKSRNIAENVFRRLPVRPVSWENYRPLWYTTFDNEAVLGSRI